jgi:hypothetical protein
MQKQNSEKSSLWKEILGVLSSIVPMAVYYKKQCPLNNLLTNSTK